MLERVYQALKIVGEVQERVEMGQPLEGMCALVTAVASTPAIDLSRIPPLEQLHESILVLRERRNGGLHASVKSGDVNELIERYSQGMAKMVGSWPVEEDDGWLIDEAVANPASTLRDLLSGDGDDEILRDVKVTAIMIRQNYQSLESGERQVGHVLAVIPDQFAFERDIRRMVGKIEREGVGPLHEVVDLTIWPQNSLVNTAGLTLETGDGIAKSVNASHPIKGKPKAFLDFVITKR